MVNWSETHENSPITLPGGEYSQTKNLAGCIIHRHEKVSDEEQETHPEACGENAIAHCDSAADLG